MDIIIVSCNKSERFRKMTQEAIDSCLKSGNHEIIVIETCKDGFSYRDSQTIRYAGKFNYHKCMNIGIGMSSGEFIAICNNDVLFDKDWSDKIEHVFKVHPEYDSLSPFCPGYHDGMWKLSKGDHLLEGHQIGRLIPGWCIVFRRSILKKIGKLNEDVEFWYSDNIYGDQIIKERIRHALVCNSFVSHIGAGSQTLNTLSRNDNLDLTRRQQPKYRKTRNNL